MEVGGREVEEKQSSNRPNLGAAVFEKLQEFGDHDVERPVQGITVQQLRGILTDLLQRSKRPLRDREEVFFLKKMHHIQT